MAEKNRRVRPFHRVPLPAFNMPVLNAGQHSTKRARCAGPKPEGRPIRCAASYHRQASRRKGLRSGEPWARQMEAPISGLRTLTRINSRFSADLVSSSFRHRIVAPFGGSKQEIKR
jgi:hypothetical protein